MFKKVDPNGAFKYSHNPNDKYEIWEDEAHPREVVRGAAVDMYLETHWYYENRMNEVHTCWPHGICHASTVTVEKRDQAGEIIEFSWKSRTINPEEED